MNIFFLSGNGFFETLGFLLSVVIVIFLIHKLLEYNNWVKDRNAYLDYQEQVKKKNNRPVKRLETQEEKNIRIKNHWEKFEELQKEKAQAIIDNPAIVKAHPVTDAVITYFKDSEGKAFAKVWVKQKIPYIHKELNEVLYYDRSKTIVLDKKTAKEMESVLVNDEPYPIKGKIVTTHSIEPFYDGQYPLREGGMEYLTRYGEPIYVDYSYEIEGSNVTDTVFGSASWEYLNLPE
jgi:hypothetical protein